MSTIIVQVQKDHISSLCNGTPILALTELIWNALDADAFEVKIDLIQNALGGIDAIRISDDGLGIDLSDNGRCFGSLGGSWKRTATATPLSARVIHGRKGKGRFKAFALGDRVEWRTTVKTESGGLRSWILSGHSSRPGVFDLNALKSPGPATGTEVYISEPSKEPTSLLNTEMVVQQLASQFALYLKAYPNVHIWFQGLLVNPIIVQRYEQNYPLRSPEGREALLQVIEWKTRQGRGKIVFCDADGFALHEVESGVRPGSQFNYTAYLISPYFKQLHAENILTLDEMHPEIRAFLDGARELLRAHFRARKEMLTENLFNEWKKQRVYPYQGEPADENEKKLRKCFDTCALAVRAVSPNFDQLVPIERQLLFSLLKEKVEADPNHAVEEIGSLLGLPLHSKKR